MYPLVPIAIYLSYVSLADVVLVFVDVVVVTTHWSLYEVAVEVAVKDGKQFDDAWSYFDFSPKKGRKELRKTAAPFATEKCYDCHLEHATVDNVFVQFYPVLRRLHAEDD